MARSKTSRSSAGHGAVRSRLAAADDAGFTLAEAVVSMVLFMLIAGPATVGLIQTIRLTGVNRDTTGAANLATQELERVRLLNSTGHLSDVTPRTVTVHSVRYTVTSTLNPLVSSTCNAGSSRRVYVNVTWPGGRSARYDSVLAC